MAGFNRPRVPAAADGGGARPGWWLRGGHLQTTWAPLFRSRRLVAFQREVLTAPDGEDLVLDHLPGPAGSPRVLLLHGLEGSAQSFHTQGLARMIARAGWRATVLNFRSCARDAADIRRRLPMRRPRLYHSGETEDVAQVARTLLAREPAVPLRALGVSLGGNVLLKWLGEQGAGSGVERAVTISAPYDLAAASRFLERPAGRPYVAHFMKKLKVKAFELLDRFPRETAHLDGNRLHRARTLREFDDCVTAPLHGFAGADDYYARSSALGFLPRVRVPTLCISGVDDPLIPAEALWRARDAASEAVTFAVTTWGGHVGFVSGRWPWRPIYWAEERAIAWLAGEGGAVASGAAPGR